MPNRMEFQLSLPKSVPAPVHPDSNTALRILIMADFSGRAHRGETFSPPVDFASRPLLRVDVDNLNAIMSQVAPKLELTPNSALHVPVRIGFAQLDDFHPDALYPRLEIWQDLRLTRARLGDSTIVAQTRAKQSPAPPTEPTPPNPNSEGETDEALLARLLGRTPNPASATKPTDSAAPAIDALLQAIVQPHIVHTDPKPAVLTAIDTAISAQLRAILHHPAFQGLEASWRGVYDLIANFDSETVRVDLFDVSRQELLDDLRAAAGELTATQLYKRLIEHALHAQRRQPWSLLIGDYSFDARGEDIALLAALGTLAAHAGGPFLAASSPGMVGCASASALADPDTWQPLSTAHQENWRKLRTSVVAPWLGLALPRVLLRLPYGQKTDPIEALPFEEMPLGRDTSAYLWGNPAFVCARLIAATFVETGGEGSLGDILELDDLATHSYEQDGEPALQPATEILLSDRARQTIAAHGIMPILGHRQRNALRLTGLQSVADPPTPLAGPWRS